MTNEFSSSNMIGQGSFGSVYKGILGEKWTAGYSEGWLNLIKRCFQKLCHWMSNITKYPQSKSYQNHCSSTDFKGIDFKAVVFDYMQNRSLEDWPYQSNNQLKLSSLSMIRKLSTTIDVASAIEYLRWSKAKECSAWSRHGFPFEWLWISKISFWSPT